MVSCGSGYWGYVPIYGVIMDLLKFPEAVDMTEEAMEALSHWVEVYTEKGLSHVAVIGLLEIYKTSLAYNLLEDEDDYED